MSEFVFISIVISLNIQNIGIVNLVCSFTQPRPPVADFSILYTIIIYIYIYLFGHFKFFLQVQKVATGQVTAVSFKDFFLK